jgi:transaldolase
MKNTLRRVFDEQGQSPWLDNLQRSYITNGTLEQLVRDGVRGLTSNPTIFQKAIQGSDDYDEQFFGLIRSGVSVEDAYWQLVIADINSALDVFEHLYAQSNGTDGFVSVEVDPSLARDGDATLTAARALHARIDRPNVMIKIPATEQGLPAIRQMIAEGRNVNVTLIFSLDRYADVIESYISGLEDRAQKGMPVEGISSVASFFISRVDNEIDKQLDAASTADAVNLKGKSAINQARLAYQLFTSQFSGPRWDALASKGAQVQRPLWASTSTKNPSYPDTLYVDELIGAHTVNTLPEPTLFAFADHGTVARSIDTSVATSREQWSSLATMNIDVNKIARQLEDEGVASFIASFNDLINALKDKAKNAS